MRDRSNSALGIPRAAFTLIELVVVLVLVGIISAVVVPAVWDAARPDTTSTLTAPVVSVLRYAQRTAAEQDEQVRVIIDPETNAYHVQTTDDGVLRSSGILAFPTQAHLVTDSARLQVTFNPAGGADADSIVVSGASNTATVRVDPWTGAIDVVRR